MLTDMSLQEAPPPALAPTQLGLERRVSVAKDSSLARTGDGADVTTEGSKDWVDHLRRVHRHGDHAAFAELFAHFAPRVKAFLMKSGADETTAEECAQDVMATLWRKAHQFDAQRASVSTWIFTIARNRRIDVIRREKRPEPEALPWGPEEEPQPADMLELRQESARLNAALKRLPDKQRELVEKAYFGDLTHSQIAQATGLPLGTIKSRLRLALERLRHEMK